MDDLKLKSLPGATKTSYRHEPVTSYVKYNKSEIQFSFHAFMQVTMLQEVCTNSMKQWTNSCILDSLKGVVHTEFLSEAMALAMALA